LGSRPRQGLAKLQAKRGSPRVMLYAPESVGKCEGMNLHTSKGASFFGVGVLMDS